MFQPLILFRGYSLIFSVIFHSSRAEKKLPVGSQEMNWTWKQIKDSGVPWVHDAIVEAAARWCRIWHHLRCFDTFFPSGIESLPDFVGRGPVRTRRRMKQGFLGSWRSTECLRHGHSRLGIQGYSKGLKNWKMISMAPVDSPRRDGSSNHAEHISCSFLWPSLRGRWGSFWSSNPLWKLCCVPLRTCFLFAIRLHPKTVALLQQSKNRMAVNDLIQLVTLQAHKDSVDKICALHTEPWFVWILPCSKGRFP